MQGERVMRWCLGRTGWRLQREQLGVWYIFMKIAEWVVLYIEILDLRTSSSPMTSDPWSVPFHLQLIVSWILIHFIFSRTTLNIYRIKLHVQTNFTNLSIQIGGRLWFGKVAGRWTVSRGDSCHRCIWVWKSPVLIHL